jgi:transposase
MITIVEHGNPNILLEKRTFKCERCGCVFTAMTEDYQVQFDVYGKRHYFCSCPETFCDGYGIEVAAGAPEADEEELPDANEETPSADWSNDLS